MPAHTRFQAVLAEKLAESLTGPLPSGTPRRVHGPVALKGKATAVIGMRRAGKTTFLHQIRRERLDRGVAREQLPYLNFEDERLAGLRGQALGGVVEEYYRQFPRLRHAATVTWCFDELQVVDGWERFVRRLLDTENVEIFLSGSSASLLSREIATSMRGRAWAVVIHPFSFVEYLRHHGEPVPDRLDLLSAPDRSRLDAALRTYLVAGGFPEVQGVDAETRYRLLADYVDVAILRDVVERHGVTNVAGLRWMVRQLLGTPAGLFSAEKFYGALRSQGIAIAKDTVHDLLAHLEDCFLVRTSWVDASSERRRRVNPRKAYPVDPGLIPIFDRTGRRNLGHALETAVRIELERRGLDVTYVRTKDGHEVDFLARTVDGKMTLIQACAELDDEDTCARETRALLAASAEHPGASLELVTLAPEQAENVPASIALRSAATWLLADQLG
ncbi:MAG: ATP-binding protein [Acidobacteria bacterium]|nr:ATP-binding protein [Acidobacteriota bacterium]